MGGSAVVVGRGASGCCCGSKCVSWYGSCTFGRAAGRQAGGHRQQSRAALDRLRGPTARRFRTSGPHPLQLCCAGGSPRRLPGICRWGWGKAAGHWPGPLRARTRYRLDARRKVVALEELVHLVVGLVLGAAPDLQGRSTPGYRGGGGRVLSCAGPSLVHPAGQRWAATPGRSLPGRRARRLPGEGARAAGCHLPRSALGTLLGVRIAGQRGTACRPPQPALAKS